ncbi:unnamed protein product [Lepeophtheirus salmonis]|uniref:(salmon louse) hypothetical protein n=1 Tax=Lepeophtheirus salmonis TaxID=72036 RepID=A0A7R8H2Y2_LEPSM|nr:unnamed protein product [Lepeophtheirus salmonis]CAF2835407.1 unnamed protein product [Lepeophtheirus salmonis]
MRSTIASLFICSTFCVAQRFITESSCEDRNSTECQIFVKEYPSYCFNPSNHHPCAESCGVCKAKCKDYHSACMRDAKILCFDGRDYHCPKMCGNCNVCEDLVHSSLCRKSQDRCKEDPNIRYSCRKTCKICSDDQLCNDAMPDVAYSCSLFERKGYCIHPMYSETMKKMCRKTCCTFCVAQRFITESSCEDRNSTECQIFVKEYPSYCFNPSNHHPCAESCGVCKAKCKDYHSACMRDAKILCFDGRDYHCPKMCGNCNVCEDLVHSSLCRKSQDRCKEDPNIRYSCRKTCKICSDDQLCNDAMPDVAYSCSLFERKGYCMNPMYSETMKKMCRKTCWLKLQQ